MVAKKSVQRLGFRTGEYIVYPAHGVGMIATTSAWRASSRQRRTSTMSVPPAAPLGSAEVSTTTASRLSSGSRLTMAAGVVRCMRWAASAVVS